jgi:hypothetical protein
MALLLTERLFTMALIIQAAANSTLLAAEVF